MTKPYVFQVFSLQDMTSSANEKVARAKKTLVDPSQADFREGEAEFVCILCQFNCHDNRSFQNHLKDHEAERPFQCSECEFRGKTKKQLTSHSKIHFTPKKYSCQFCEYKTRDKRDLDKHTRIHTGETPFKCDLCDYSGKHQFHLTRHKNIVHRRILEHICFFCNANFGRRDQLERHIRKHTTEKPFPCQSCNREFTDLSSLRKHQRSNYHKKNSSSNDPSESLTVQHSVPQKSRKERRNPKELVAQPPHFLQNERRNIRRNTSERIRFKKVRVPVLLPVEILKKLAPGEEDPYAVPENSNAEVSSPETAPQFENPKTENQVRAVAEDPLDSGPFFGTSTEQDGCQTMQTSGEQTENEAIPCRRISVDLRTLPPKVPKEDQVLKAIVQNLDNALNMALSLRREGRKGPYVCACCSFSCRRQDRLQRHCKRNHFSEDSQNLAPNSKIKLGVRRSETKLDESAFLHLNQYEQSPGFQSEVSLSDPSPENSFLSPRGRNVKPSEDSEDAHSTCSTEIVSPISPLILKPDVRIRKGTSERKRFDCDFCDQMFPSAYALLDHLRHHTGQQLYKCRIPDCNFKTIRNDLYQCCPILFRIE